jgi:hypothetical protein
LLFAQCKMYYWWLVTYLSWLDGYIHNLGKRNRPEQLPDWFDFSLYKRR